MNISTFWLVLLLMAALMTTLTWVGLRFFCASEGQTPRSQTAPRIRRWMPRYRWPQLRGAFRLSSILSPLKNQQIIWVAVTLLLVGFTVSLTLALSNCINPPAITGVDMGPTGTAGVVLREEVLVPPQPLPPSMFIGTESFDLEHADRDWGKLDAGFRNTVLQLFAKMESRGYRMALLEGFRSAERQEMLAEKGLSVTHARAGLSKHQYGFAVDIAPVRNDRLMISSWDPWAASAYKALGEEAEKMGLAWGGNWAMRDLGHVEHAAKISSSTKQPVS